jgi:hypothetical protein
MRLLRCFTCLTLEELPDAPKGVDPNAIEPGQDPLLDDLIERHRSRPECGGRSGQMFQVADADWRDEKRREEILRQMGVETTGLPGEFYEVKATFHEDALKCFDRHNRPEGYCIDWKDDSKRLGRATPEGKAWQKQNQDAPTMHLCDFCPVASTVAVAQRAATGAYNN